MTQDPKLTIFLAEMIRDAADVCDGKPTAGFEGITIHCPDPQLLECANEVLRANEKGEGLDVAVENFNVQLSESRAEGSEF